MRSVPFGKLAVGDEETWAHDVTAEEVDALARLSGDVNPLHMQDEFARRQGFRGRVVHGVLLSAFLSRVLGTRLPGPGALWLTQDTRFARPVYVGERIEVRVRVKHKSQHLRSLVLDTTITNSRGETVMSGEARMMVMPEGDRPPWSETVAMVTGGSRGIGAAMCRALAEEGATIVVGYHASREAAESVVADIENGGGTAAAMEADLAEVAGAESLATGAIERFGRVDVLVNNATPPIVRKSIDETSWEDVDTYLRLYVQSAFALSKALIPGMRERQFGRFVHVLTSAIWGVPPPSTAAYVTAKSAVWGLAKGMAVDLAQDGISVNAVSPSAVMSDQWADEPDSRLRSVASRIPMRRLAGPEEVAAAVVFLAGQGGDYITGANIPVAGGEVM